MRVQLAAATILASALLLPAAVSGQEATGTGTVPRAATEMQRADMQFVKDAAAAGNAEIELGKLATEKASDAKVKEFGQRLVDDHTKAADQLKQIAQGKSIDIPSDLPPDATAEKERLSGLAGAEFDREFITHMVAGHEKAVDLFSKQAEGGQDAELKEFAAQTLPTLQGHLDEAQRLQTSLQPVAGATQEQQTQPSAGGTTADQGMASPPATEGKDQGMTSPSTTAQGTPDQGTSPTATQEAARPAYPLGDKTADDLIGRKVVNRDGDEVGEIADIVLDANDRAVFAVVSVGGFFGFGEKNVTVPFDQLEASDTDALLMSSATEDQLKALPEYQPDAAGYTALPHDRPISEGAQ